MSVKPKKHLGQHFLKNDAICHQIAAAIGFHETKQVLEIGPGTGALTKHLLELDAIDLKVIELDRESIAYLQNHFEALDNDRVIEGDFLKLPLDTFFKDQFIIVGNFPYNISSQILFKIFEQKETVPEMVGMFQKEVAARVCSGPGKKAYGILSVLLQTYYEVEYLFTVDETEFDPPPKVKSGVMRMKRKEDYTPDLTPEFLKMIVKLAFNQRRKTLRNSMKSLINEKEIETTDPIFNQRPEQLGFEEFQTLGKMFL